MTQATLYHSHNNNNT